MATLCINNLQRFTGDPDRSAAAPLASNISLRMHVSMQISILWQSLFYFMSNCAHKGV